MVADKLKRCYLPIPGGAVLDKLDVACANARSRRQKREFNCKPQLQA